MRDSRDETRRKGRDGNGHPAYSEALDHLTRQQRLFVEEYLVDLNATQAAIRAGYSAKTANEQAARLLANVSMRSAVDAAVRLRVERTRVRADRVVHELARIAFADLGDFLDWGPSGIRLRPKATLLADQRAAVAQMSERPGRHGPTLSIKLHDKVGALQLLGRHVGMFSDAGVSHDAVRALIEGVFKLLQRRLPGDQLESALLELRQVAAITDQRGDDGAVGA